MTSVNEKQNASKVIEIDDDDEPEADEPQRSAACTFNPNFRPPSPAPKQSIYSDDDDSDDGLDLLDLFDMWYGDLYKDGTLNENIPRWRLHYEYTGRVDKVFKGEKKMLVKISDINESLKFTDDSRTKVQLNDPTNKLVLAYQDKKVKRPILTAANISSCSTFGMKINSEHQGITVCTNNQPTTSRSADKGKKKYRFYWHYWILYQNFKML